MLQMPETFDKDLLRWAMGCFSVLIFNKKMGFMDPKALSIASEQTKVIDAVVIAHENLSHCETGFQVWRFVDTLFSKRLFNACDVISR